MSEFRLRQPNPEDTSASTKFYLDVANKILRTVAASDAPQWLHPELYKELALCLTGYYMDVTADAGIWRSFITYCRRRYGRTLPFFDVNEDDYQDFELNAVDVRFMVWYFVAMTDDTHRDLCPLDARVESLATLIYDILEQHYDDAPIPEDYEFTRELEFDDPADLEALYRFGSWLFFFCYLTTPAFKLTMHQIMSEPAMKSNPGNEAFARRFDQAMQEDSIGPIALFMREWLRLIVSDKMPADQGHKESMPADKPHPYWTKVNSAYPGKKTLYFADYEQLNKFFVDVIGWESGERHLPQLADSKYFVVMVNRDKGMLVAKDIAQYIADPDNPYYDKEASAAHGFELLTVRGKCPADLLMEIKERGWLPEAAWPGCADAEGRRLVADNFDFISRCYLQTYYRGD